MESTPSAAGEEPLPYPYSSPSSEVTAATPAPDAAITPSEVMQAAASAEVKSDTPPADSRPAIKLPENASLDEIIASIPDEVVARMSNAEIEALASGDLQAVAKVLNLPEPAPNPQTPASARQAALTPPKSDLESDEDGPTRISLRLCPRRNARPLPTPSRRSRKAGSTPLKKPVLPRPPSLLKRRPRKRRWSQALSHRRRSRRSSNALPTSRPSKRLPQPLLIA
ncbi:hypothetical protein [Verrucomicrobium spinosum]|uniref:hypothetical protein n=1 Tax=Verrucomicrobium spinosum TaxID=2736 RepID=UPI0012E300B9|nr:hypothetical protein [Verrucomicrobium spinosum]